MIAVHSVSASAAEQLVHLQLFAAAHMDCDHCDFCSCHRCTCKLTDISYNCVSMATALAVMALSVSLESLLKSNAATMQVRLAILTHTIAEPAARIIRMHADQQNTECFNTAAASSVHSNAVHAGFKLAMWQRRCGLTIDRLKTACCKRGKSATLKAACTWLLYRINAHNAQM
jgi:hypothetical protein